MDPGTSTSSLSTEYPGSTATSVIIDIVTSTVASMLTTRTEAAQPTVMPTECDCEECPDEMTIFILAIAAAAGFILWILTITIVCSVKFCNCPKSPCGSRDSELPNSPPPDHAPPSRQNKVNGRDNVESVYSQFPSRKESVGYDKPPTTAEVLNMEEIAEESNHYSGWPGHLQPENSLGRRGSAPTIVTNPGDGGDRETSRGSSIAERVSTARNSGVQVLPVDSKTPRSSASSQDVGAVPASDGIYEQPLPQ